MDNMIRSAFIFNNMPHKGEWIDQFIEAFEGDIRYEISREALFVWTPVKDSNRSTCWCVEIGHPAGLFEELRCLVANVHGGQLARMA